MNKRFSTLLAAALVAGGLSFNANAAVTPVDASQIKDGSFIHLGTGSSVLSVSDEGEFGLQVTTTWTGNIDKLLGTLWQVKKILIRLWQVFLTPILSQTVYQANCFLLNWNQM